MKVSFFRANRKRILDVMHYGLIVVSACTQIQRGNDAAFAFEQEANFWYLTGIGAPDWWLIIDGGDSWLVAPDIDPVHQVFNGSLSWSDAKSMSGVDKVLSRSEGESLLLELSKKHDTAYTIGNDPHAKHYDFVLNPAQKNMRTRLRKIFIEVRDCRTELSKLRAIKQPMEIDAMQKAIDLTVDTFTNTKQKLSSLKYEYEVEAEFTYSFRKSGATGHAYDPIVAGEKNACTLHYNSNNDRLISGSLLLLDVGVRVDGYAADITRTYAVGKPTKRQIAVHKAVEEASKNIIILLRPGLTIENYQKSVDTIMQDALIDLGLLKSRDDQETYRKYFPHAVSHGLGIDVHDSLGRPYEFLPGMVLTVEPGIYIPEESIGVRIEDNILITETGHRNLSSALPTSL